VPKEVHITPRMYQKLTQKIAGKPEERILSYLMLRSLKQARYSEENVGHFALAAPTYTPLPSPIRRYPDLIVHRVLKEVLSVEDGRGVPAHGETPSPWSKRSGKGEVEGRKSKSNVSVNDRRGAAKGIAGGHDRGSGDKGIVSGHDFSRAVKHAKNK